LRESRNPFGVILETFPLDKEQVACGLFDAPIEGKRPEAWHRGGDRLRLGERAFEALLLARYHVEDCMLKEHPTTLPR